MDVWGTIERHLPVGSARSAVELCHTKIRENSGDYRAFAHLQLYKIYSKKAAESLFLSMPFRHLAMHHLEQAIRRSELLAEPLVLRATLMFQRGELSDCLSDLEIGVARQRSWMQIPSMHGDSERFRLCKYLLLKGEVEVKVGRLHEGWESLGQAWEESNQLGVSARAKENESGYEILHGMILCLLLEMKYEEAHDFITSVSKGQMLSALESRQRGLPALQNALAALIVDLRDVNSPRFEGNLWQSLVEEIERCKTTDEARRLRPRILEKLSSHDVSCQIQKLAEAIVAVQEKSRHLLQKVQQALSRPLSLPDEVTDPTLRQMSENAWRLLEAPSLLAAMAIAGIDETTAQVRTFANPAYNIPFRHRLRWFWWGIQRWFIQIFVLAFLLDRFFHKLLEEVGKSAPGPVRLDTNEVVVDLSVAILGVIFGKFLEKKIDEGGLDKYKHELVMLLSNRLETFWIVHNALLKILETNSRTLAQVEENLKSHPDKTVLA